ncbi:MAG: hypothetical protein KA335_09030 [Ramlibacter sp.]|jgi:predicted Zn finger-like uncharacterized protein|nr:hypothetical protein [Ramlibacter sp.]
MGSPQRNYLNHPLADGIRKVGFRKWYERELLSSHAHMVLALLATIAMLGSFEAFRGGTLEEKLMDVLFIIASALIGLWALRRYLMLLGHAEVIANQASCPSCDEYGRFEVVDEDRRNQRMQVRCRKCTGLWQIED